MESVSVPISLSDFRIANDVVCVFGQREFSLFRWSKLVDSAFCDASPFYANDHFVDWIWDVCILNADDQPLRVAVCGNMVSPPLFEGIVLMDRADVLARIDGILANIFA